MTERVDTARGPSGRWADTLKRVSAAKLMAPAEVSMATAAAPTATSTGAFSHATAIAVHPGLRRSSREAATTAVPSPTPSAASHTSPSPSAGTATAAVASAGAPLARPMPQKHTATRATTPSLMQPHNFDAASQWAHGEEPSHRGATRSTSSPRRASASTPHAAAASCAESAAAEFTPNTAVQASHKSGVLWTPPPPFASSSSSGVKAAPTPKITYRTVRTRSHEIGDGASAAAAVALSPCSLVSPGDTTHLTGSPGDLTPSRSVMRAPEQQQSGGTWRRRGHSGDGEAGAALSRSPFCVDPYVSGIHAVSPPASTSVTLLSSPRPCRGVGETSVLTNLSTPGGASVVPPVMRGTPATYDVFAQPRSHTQPRQLAQGAASSHAGHPPAARGSLANCGARGSSAVPSPSVFATPTAHRAVTGSGGPLGAYESLARGAASANSPSCGDLSPAALEKQLYDASKGELVQMLLELASRNGDASHFIQARANLFPSYRGHGAAGGGGGAGGASVGCDGKSNKETRAGSLIGGGAAAAAVAPADATGADEAPAASERSEVRWPSTQVPLPKSKQPAAAATGLQEDDTARCIFPGAEADEEEEQEKEVRETASAKTTNTMALSPCEAVQQRSVTSTPSQCTQVRPEDRRFSDQLHPCLHWYGGCRNATSCVYVSVPRNTCLNWILGSCTAQAECRGVHRLPSPCPPKVHKIYSLHHGLDRGEAGAAAAAAAQVRLSHHQLSIPPPLSTLTPGARTAPTSRVARPLAPVNAHDVHLEGSSSAHPSTPMVESDGVRTPTNQSIDKDTCMLGGSTPHRHPPGRDAELRGAPVARGEAETVWLADLVKAATAAVASCDAGEAFRWRAPVVRPGVDDCRADAPAEHEMDFCAGDGSSNRRDVAPASRAAARTAETTGSGVPNVDPDDVSAWLPRTFLDAHAPSESSRHDTEDNGVEPEAGAGVPVSRCLGPHFDRAATAVPVGEAVTETPTDAVKSFPSIANCVCNVTRPLVVVPATAAPGCTNGSGGAGALRDIDDDGELSAPAAGTRTRVQSPYYGA